MISIEQQQEFLICSYFSHDGQVAREKLEIPPRERYNWVPCAPNDPERDKTYVSLSGLPVKKKQGLYLSRFRQLEFLHSLSPLTLDRIFSSHKPKKYFMDIETSMKFGIAPGKMIEDPRESILTNAWCDQEGNITATGVKPLTLEEVNDIEAKINEHFKKLNRKYTFTYKHYDSEKSMLTDLIEYHIPKMPFIAGWNFEAFDWAYIMARSEYAFKIDIKKTSPTGKMEKITIKRKFAKEGEGIRTVRPLHRAIVDYLVLYEKWDTSVAIKESSKLDYVGQEVFGVKKVEYPGTLTELYNNDFPLYIFYNCVDCALVEAIDRKLCTFDIMMKLSQRSKIPLNHAVYMSVAITSAMSKKAKDRGVILLADDLIEDDGSFPGAYVKEPLAGLFKYVSGYDFASLYPSIMMALNISLDSFLGLINEDKVTYTEAKTNIIKELNETHIRAASGAVYDRTKSSIMRDILIDFIDARLFAKNSADDIDAEIAQLKQMLKDKAAA